MTVAEGLPVVVTGAASGIGARTCHELVDAGWDVIGVDRNQADCFPGTFIQADLSTPEGIAGLVEHLPEELAALVNIAGVPGTAPAGVVLAFNHAYYVERSVERAFQAVAPSSPLDRGVLFRDGVARLAPGTAHCVDARVVDDRHVAVVLTERPPGAEPVVFHQRIRVEPLTEGRWGIVAITPAG